MSDRIPTGFTEATVETNGAIIHYLRGGKGEPIVLLHGWPQTWFEWRLVMPLLAEHYDVIVPSLRGVEGSRALDGRYDAATMAGDVRELLRRLGIERAFIVGHDIGMLVAHAFAVRFPAATTKLVIIEGLLIGLEPMTTEFSRFPRAWNFGFNMTPDLPEVLTAGRERTFFDYFFNYIAADPASITEEARAEYVRAYQQPGAMSAGFGWYRAFPDDMDFIVKNAATKLTMPVLGLGGDKVMGGFMVPMLEQVAEDVRGYSLVDCGHYVPEEKPVELVQQLDTFLQG